MKYLSILFFLILFTTQSFAQHINFDPTRSKEINVRQLEQFEGTPYYNKDWLPGYVNFNSDEKSETVNLKYISFSNQLIFKQNGKILAINPASFKSFVLLLNNKNITFKKGFTSQEYNISPDLLLEAIYDGKVKLVAEHKNKLRKHRDPLKGKVTNEFDSDTDYFLVDAEGTFHEVDLKENDILKALGNHQDELKQYAQQQNIDFEEKDGLQQILLKYDEMLKSGY